MPNEGGKFIESKRGGKVDENSAHTQHSARIRPVCHLNTDALSHLFIRRQLVALFCVRGYTYYKPKYLQFRLGKELSHKNIQDVTKSRRSHFLYADNFYIYTKES
jgi:hypothetical protein